MLRKLIEQLQKLATPAPPFDPSRFGDPVARQIAWTPAKGGGASFRTHKLVEVDYNRVEFRAAIGAKIFYSVFAALGLVAMIVIPLEVSSSENANFGNELLIPVLIGLIFVTVGIVMFFFGTSPIVFDKTKGSFWKGRKTPDDVLNPQELKYFARLADIHALQIVSERCRSKNSHYTSYELNLVLKDGKRINVVDHGNPARLKDDAQKLSAFLGKPVWDATAIEITPMS